MTKAQKIDTIYNQLIDTPLLRAQHKSLAAVQQLAALVAKARGASKEDTDWLISRINDYVLDGYDAGRMASKTSRKILFGDFRNEYLSVSLEVKELMSKTDDTRHTSIGGCKYAIPGHISNILLFKNRLKRLKATSFV